VNGDTNPIVGVIDCAGYTQVQNDGHTRRTIEMICGGHCEGDTNSIQDKHEVLGRNEGHRKLETFSLSTGYI